LGETAVIEEKLDEGEDEEVTLYSLGFAADSLENKPMSKSRRRMSSGSAAPPSRNKVRVVWSLKRDNGLLGLGFFLTDFVFKSSAAQSPRSIAKANFDKHCPQAGSSESEANWCGFCKCRDFRP